MVFKSEIRDSTYEKLLEKVQKHDYGKYLYRIVLKRIRGFENQKVTFDFPVTAIIGPNGGGKTTILGAAGLAYKDVAPKRFFIKSNVFDPSMEGWEINYEIIDKEIEPTELLHKSANFKTERWRRSNKLPKRHTSIHGVFRTVPPTEKKEFGIAIQKEIGKREREITAEALNPTIARYVNLILGNRNVEYKRNFFSIKWVLSRTGTILTGKLKDTKNEYSEYHFGAGEASIIRMIVEIESLPKNSLILIEEIENGLHPVATYKMVEYLIDLAERNSIQVIFTTHSNDALKPLPSEAIWSSYNGKVIQGKLDIDLLMLLVGEVDTKLFIFTEDDLSKMWLKTILRNQIQKEMKQIEVYNLEGDGTAVKMHKAHNKNPTKIADSICFVDGDSKQTDSEDESIFRLPGFDEKPEIYIYKSILDKIDEESCLRDLSVSLQCINMNANELKEQIIKIYNDTGDHHNIFSCHSH